jgi:hypothetical protein
MLAMHVWHLCPSEYIDKSDIELPFSKESQG